MHPPTRHVSVRVRTADAIEVGTIQHVNMEVHAHAMTLVIVCMAER